MSADQEKYVVVDGNNQRVPGPATDKAAAEQLAEAKRQQIQEASGNPSAGSFQVKQVING